MMPAGNEYYVEIETPDENKRLNSLEDRVPDITELPDAHTEKIKDTETLVDKIISDRKNLLQKTKGLSFQSVQRNSSKVRSEKTVFCD